MKTSAVRKPIPVRVKLEVALRALGYTKDEIAREIEWDHGPALGLRRWNAEAGDFEPPQHDPEFILIRLKPDHKRKTSGRHGESDLSVRDGDAQKIAKLRKVETAHEEFRRRLLAKDAGEPRPPSKWRSRPFPKRKKPRAVERISP